MDLLVIAIFLALVAAFVIRAWKARDVERLYRGFGFEQRRGGAHMVYFHPHFPDLMATVTHASGLLPTGYITDALDLLNLLEGRQASEEGK